MKYDLPSGAITAALALLTLLYASPSPLALGLSSGDDIVAFGSDDMVTLTKTSSVPVPAIELLRFLYWWCGWI